MKVFIHYEEPAAESLRQTLKITLPKKWEKGPCSNLMDTFVKNYNAKHPENQLNGSQLRIETEMREVVPMHAVVCERVHDRADLYVKFGAAGAPPTRLGGGGAKSGGFEAGAGGPDAMRACKNFGCNKKYCERTNFDGECRHHTKPPVFHETAKYWSCCPHKKAYDWESFMPVHKSNSRSASPQPPDHVLHAIDATPARWRAPGGLSPLDSVSTVAFRRGTT